jgi:flagellar hook assembly protein FlgD
MTVFGAQDASGLADGTAYLNINNADWGDFDAEWTNAEIDGDGSYTVAMVASEGQALAQFNALEVVNGESYLGTGCVLTVDSIKINGEDVELQGASYTCSADGAGETTRVNIYNEWNAPDDTATAGDDNHLDNRVADGNVMDATACLFDSSYVDASSGSGFKVESIEVNFTVSGFGTQAAGSDAAAEDGVGEVDLNGTYHAYIGLQTPVYSFRNAFDDETYGYGTEYFDQITGWDGSDPVKKDGTFTDAEIAGNGTYTVSVSGMNFGDEEFADQDYMNLIFLSTDIPNTGDITISDIVLTVDGQTPSINPILSPDSVNYVNMLIQNIWNDDVATIGYYNVPPTEMSITFTVSGFAYDNEAAVAPAEEEATTDDAAAAETAEEETETTSGGVSPVVVVVIVVVVVAIVAGVVVASKKKKGNN